MQAGPTAPSSQSPSRSKILIRVHLRSSAAKYSCLRAQHGHARAPRAHAPTQLTPPSPRPSRAHRQHHPAARPGHANSPPQRLRPEHKKRPARKNARHAATVLRPTAPTRQAIHTTRTRAAGPRTFTISSPQRAPTPTPTTPFKPFRTDPLNREPATQPAPTAPQFAISPRFRRQPIAASTPAMVSSR